MASAAPSLAGARRLALTPVLATPENFAAYGNLFADPAAEQVRLERWPKHAKGW
jgi:hypothetical protein